MSENNQSTCKLYARLLKYNINLRELSNRSISMRGNFIKMLEEAKAKNNVIIDQVKDGDGDLSAAEEVSNKSEVIFKEGANVYAHLRHLEGNGPNLLEDLPGDKTYDFPNFEETTKFKNAHNSLDLIKKQNDDFVDSGDVWEQLRASEIKSSSENVNIIPAGADLGSYMQAYVNRNDKNKKSKK